MTYTPKPGDYIYCPDLTDEQIEAFVGDCRPHVKSVEGDYMGYIRGRLPYLTIDGDNDLWTYPEKHRFMTNNVTANYQGESPMPTTRNPFQEGDRVVPTGFKAHPDGDYYFGPNGHMEQWERDSTVLEVKATLPVCVEAGPPRSRRTYSYHPSELRMATQAEVEKANKPKQPALERGMVIKAKDSGMIAMVLDPTSDFDGDIRVCYISNLGDIYFRVSLGYEILGQIMEDGDYRPAAAIRTADDT